MRIKSPLLKSIHFKKPITWSPFLSKSVVIFNITTTNMTHIQKLTFHHTVVGSWCNCSYLIYMQKVKFRGTVVRSLKTKVIKICIPFFGLFSISCLLKFVHFKKPVTQSSFLSKSIVIFVVVILKMTTLFERNEDHVIGFLKWMDFSSGLFTRK